MFAETVAKSLTDGSHAVMALVHAAIRWASGTVGAGATGTEGASVVVVVVVVVVTTVVLGVQSSLGGARLTSPISDSGSAITRETRRDDERSERRARNPKTRRKRPTISTPELPPVTGSSQMFDSKVGALSLVGSQIMT